jgi:ribosomal protein L15
MVLQSHGARAAGRCRPAGKESGRHRGKKRRQKHIVYSHKEHFCLPKTRSLGKTG